MYKDGLTQLKAGLLLVKHLQSFEQRYRVEEVNLEFHCLQLKRPLERQRLVFFPNTIVYLMGPIHQQLGNSEENIKKLHY